MRIRFVNKQTTYYYYYFNIITNINIIIINIIINHQMVIINNNYNLYLHYKNVEINKKKHKRYITHTKKTTLHYVLPHFLK